MSLTTVLNRMLHSLPDTNAWFGGTKAPNVTTLMRIEATEVNDIAELVQWAKDAVILMQSRTDACDLWGRDCELPRQAAETDENYRARIQAEILRKRNTAPSIEIGLSDLLNRTGTVYEPWRDVLRFGQHSKLGRNKLTGRYYTNATIDVKVEGNHPLLIDTIYRLRACGVLPFTTLIYYDDINMITDERLSETTQIIDLTSRSRHDTHKAAEMYDENDNFVCKVEDPNAPPFLTDGITGYDRTP